MPKFFISLLLFTLVLNSCEIIENNPSIELPDGFCMVFADSVILSHEQIDYYDYSAHMVYLKNISHIIQDYESGAEFKVYADREEIYTGLIHPSYSSTLPMSPVIHSMPIRYGDYVISIDQIQVVDTSGIPGTDVRNDARIVQALQKYGQFHEGLECEIDTIYHTEENNHVTVRLELKNNDSYSYYYLDPDKMGEGLFHYFTNGLVLWDFGEMSFYENQMEHIQPDPWDSWEPEWLSLLQSGETRLLTFSYDSFDVLSSGTYRAYFNFPGLSYQVGFNEVSQENGRIWLGTIHMTTDLVVR